MAQKQHIIRVTVDQGVLKYDATSNGAPHSDGKKVHVKQNDTVQWTSSSGALVVLFKRTPFAHSALAAEVNQTTSAAKVDKKGVKGGDNTYRYFVAVVTQPDGVVVPEDPEIIIDEDPG